MAERNLTEAAMRSALIEQLREEQSNCSEAFIVEELGILQGSNRVDVAVIDGSLHGYEIKSDDDRLERLPSQQDAYCRVFDFVTIVTTSRHLNQVRGLVPGWWGIRLARRSGGDLQLVKERRTRKNPCLDAAALVQLLWRDEAFDILSELGLHAGLKTKPRRHLWMRLADVVPPDILAEYIRGKLRQRKLGSRGRDGNRVGHVKDESGTAAQGHARSEAQAVPCGAGWRCGGR